MGALKLDKIVLSAVNKLDSSWESLYPNLFSNELGCLKGKEFIIDIDQSIPPKFCKARTVPYALRDKISNELERLQTAGIISPVAYSPWAAPIVPVLKGDGTIRICGDFKLTVNRASNLDSYPIPKLQDIFSNLSGVTKFSKLGISSIPSKIITTFLGF